MRHYLKVSSELMKKTVGGWFGNRAASLGAALSFYTILAIPPLVVITLFIVGLWFDVQSARGEIIGQVQQLLGRTGAHAVEGVLEHAGTHAKGFWASVAALFTLIITATGVFVELQGSLNFIWHVQPKPGRGLWVFIRNRMLSFAMVVAIGFLLLVSLLLSAGLAALGNYMSGLLPGMDTFWQAANFVVSFGVISVLFAMMFKVLPDAEISWRNVWIGAVLTAVLFTAGKFVLGKFLAQNRIATAYGAAGSLVILLLWVYYSAQILYFGAQFTQIYATRFGHLRPSPHAEWDTQTHHKKSSPKTGNSASRKGRGKHRKSGSH